MDKYQILSSSINEDTGTARIIIDGYIPAPYECDDPIVELFRPVRNKYKEQMFFTILTKHKDEVVICDILASNSDSLSVEKFIATAKSTLEGGANAKGVIGDYRDILNKYFKDEDGLNTYLKKIAEAEKATETEATAIYVAANASIKAFVAKTGLAMPSLKRKAKPRKTKEQKKADSEAYLREHPEILANNKKSAK